MDNHLSKVKKTPNSFTYELKMALGLWLVIY